MPVVRASAIAALYSLVLGASTGSVAAQTPVRDSAGGTLADLELVYSASRYAQETRDAPASVTIITAREIREYGYETLADVLGAVRGFSTRYDFNNDYATVRGLARLGDFNTRLLILLDGQRLNGAVADVSNIGTDALIDLNRIHHIEIIRGPGSALFGTNAFFGVINIVTGGGRGEPAGLQADAEAGHLGTYRGGLAWSIRPGPSRALTIAGSAQRRAGADRYYPEFDTPATNNGIAHGLDDEETYRIFGKGRWGDWSAEGAYSQRRRNIPTASFGATFNTRPMEARDRTAAGALTYTHSFADLSRLTVAAGFNRATHATDFAYTPTITSAYQRGNIWSLETQYLRVVGPGHKVTVGGELRYASKGEQGVIEETPPAPVNVILRDVRSQLVGAVFAQVEWRLGGRALLYTGVRHDQYERVGGTTNPRAALVLRPAERTTVKALYGAAFRAPSFRELYFQDGGRTQRAPPSLRPERVHTFELEVEQRLGGLTASVSAYRVITKDLINQTVDSADGLLVYENDGRPTTRGVELELRGRLGPVTGRASYAFQEALDNSRDRPEDSPRHLFRVGASAPLIGGRANLALEVRHVGERPTLTGPDAPGYTLVNLTVLARPIDRHLELILGVKDLFDDGHVDPGGEEHRQNVLAQDGRSVHTGLRVAF